MSENLLQLIAFLKLILVAGFALLYGSGGISGKWKRRIIAPILYTLGLIGFSLWTGSFSWWYLLCAPLLYGALSIGYGGDSLSEKLIKRSRYGLVCAIASLPVLIVNGAWTLIPLHILVCVAVSTVAGVWNQTSSARSEETLIAASIVLIPLMTV